MQSLIKFVDQRWKILSGVGLALIAVMSLVPLPELPLFPGSDKTHHLIAYSLLMFPVALHKPKKWLWIALGFTAWSGVIELIQPYVNRYGEWLDLLANTLGVVMGFVIARCVIKFNNRVTLIKN